MNLFKVISFFLLISVVENSFSQTDNWVQDINSGSPFEHVYLDGSNNLRTLTMRTYYNRRYSGNRAVSCNGALDAQAKVVITSDDPNSSYSTIPFVNPDIRWSSGNPVDDTICNNLPGDIISIYVSDPGAGVNFAQAAVNIPNALKLNFLE